MTIYEGFLGLGRDIIRVRCRNLLHGCASDAVLQGRQVSFPFLHDSLYRHCGFGAVVGALSALHVACAPCAIMFLHKHGLSPSLSYYSPLLYVCAAIRTAASVNFIVLCEYRWYIDSPVCRAADHRWDERTDTVSNDFSEWQRTLRCSHNGLDS
jgi:hypothetical protein